MLCLENKIGDLSEPSKTERRSLRKFFAELRPLVDREEYLYDIEDMVKLECSTETT